MHTEQLSQLLKFHLFTVNTGLKIMSEFHSPSHDFNLHEHRLLTDQPLLIILAYVFILVTSVHFSTFLQRHWNCI